MNVLFRLSSFLWTALVFSTLPLIGDEVSSIAPPLSPAESIATMKIQPGYSVVPVLVEPHIHEPSAIAWDGNGRLYVVEMRTYMQDIDGTNQLAPTSRVSRHEDTDGDGVYDKHAVFADNLALPRMVLPLLDRVIIRETNTLDLKSYQDSDGDGVADMIEIWHEGGNRGGNLEHQPSGLIWNIDNWIYTTYSRHRYRFTGGQVIQEPMPHGSGQWGLTHDDEGRIFYSTAGGENPAMDFQRPIIYGQLSLPGEQADGFREVFPIDNVPDVQGGLGRVRSDNTLNHFTGCCGQSIFRGTAMPSDFRGDLIIPEPVGRLIRRAKVNNDHGRIIVSNAYERDEFIAATDPNFRPVNSATGPDGCLYLVDMYRGIIQEGNWVNRGSYLRGVVQKYQLDKNVGRGRIYRVEHESTRRGQQPRMLDETPQQLVAHLSHPNGWWRSEAQKLIVLHEDTSVVPSLQRLLRQSPNPLGRLHALWTLEGLESIDHATLVTAFADSDARVRSAAIRIAEPRLAKDRSLDSQIDQLLVDVSPDVKIQTMLSLARGGHPDSNELTERLIKENSSNLAITHLAKQLKARIAAMEAERKKLAEMRRRNKVLAESVVRGKTIFNTLCVTCHANNGMGQPSPDNQDLMLAPPLVNSPRVLGHKQRLTRILLHGLIGPVDDKTYSAGLMLPMGANDDQWIADVATYIRNEWGNKASLIEASDVSKIREETQRRLGPWTLAELQTFDPPAANRSAWKITASHNPGKVGESVDGKLSSRWDTGTTQKPGMWFQVELPEPIKAMSIVLDTSGSDLDYPRGYVVQSSIDGESWSDPVATGNADSKVTQIELDVDQPAKFLRITQTGFSPDKYWSIHEISIKGFSAAELENRVSLAELLAKENRSKLVQDAASQGSARQGALLFYNQTLSCAKCHDQSVENPLGPDLAKKRDNSTDLFLVESVLEPSRSIRKEFAQVQVLTESGLALTGFVVSDDENRLVIREPAGGKKIEIEREEIVAQRPSDLSAMPAGLVSQLDNRGQFLDLLKFLMEVRDGGSERMRQLRDAVTVTNPK